jgi:hypothetical protein
VRLARSTDMARLLDSATDADLFLLFRRGISGPMDPGWQVPASAVQRGQENVRAAAPGGLGRVRAAIGRGRPTAGILADEHPEEQPKEPRLDDAGP